MSTFIEQFPTVFSAINTGLLQTLKLFFITLLGSLPLGLIISFGSISKFKPLSVFVKTVVWIIRGTPLLLQLLIIFYFPGLVFGKPIWGSGEAGRFLASCAAFIFNYACYFSEIFRGGIQSVPKGQQEAGQVLGLSKSQIFFKITLLQMIKQIIPPVSNEVITLVKDTSLARIIGVMEIIMYAERFSKAGLIWPLFSTGLFFLAMCGILTLLLNYTEKKFDYYKG